MQVPNTVAYKIEQNARDLFMWANPDADPTSVIVPRIGVADDGSEIRDNWPEVPFALVNHDGTMETTGQESKYRDGADLVFIKPCRTNVSINGYGRETYEYLSRADIVASRYTEAPMTFLSEAGINDLSAIVEEETFESRYELDLGVTLMVKMVFQDQAPVSANTIEATVKHASDTKLVTQDLT